MTPVNRGYIGRSVLVAGASPICEAVQTITLQGGGWSAIFFPKPQGVSLAWWHSTSLVCSECSCMFPCGCAHMHSTHEHGSDGLGRAGKVCALLASGFN